MIYGVVYGNLLWIRYCRYRDFRLIALVNKNNRFPVPLCVDPFQCSEGLTRIVSMPVFRGFNKDYIQYVQQSFYSLFLYTEPKCVDLRTVIDESLSFFSIRVANSIFLYYMV